MTCTVIDVGGIRAIVCGRHRIETRPCKTCGKPATKLCDWQLGPGRRTCNEPMCDEHATSPAPGKDLCPCHNEAWLRHPANKQRALELKPSVQASGGTSTS